MLFERNSCTPGTLAGFCDFYNLGVFFALFQLVGEAVVMVWGLIRVIKAKWKKRNARTRIGTAGEQTNVSGSAV